MYQTILSLTYHWNYTWILLSMMKYVIYHYIIRFSLLPVSLYPVSLLLCFFQWN